MALNYGYSSQVVNNEKTVQYALNYPKNLFDTSVYPTRPSSGGYKYIPTHGLNSNSTITFLTHSFSTSRGFNMDDDVIIEYTFEFLSKKGNFSYFPIDKISIGPFKAPKTGNMYNMFILNKTYSFSEILKTTDFSQFVMFCVSFTQKAGMLSDDTSELELSITF